MKFDINYKEIVDSCHKGIEDAQLNYVRVTGGFCLKEAPEYYVTSSIFDTVGNLDNVYAELESRVSTTITNAEARGRGKLKQNIRPEGRCDIVVWHEDTEDEDKYYPTIPIEVKCDPIDMQKSKDDIVRLAGMLQKNSETSSIQACIFTCYLEKATKDELQKRIQQVVNQLVSYIPDQLEITHEIDSRASEIDAGDGDLKAWSSITMLLQLSK